jgi:predicted  nucleic acid-binding Zn-ribbon protein
MLCVLHKRHGCTDRDCRLERIEVVLTTTLPVLLQTITEQLDRIERKQDAMSKHLDDLTAAVTEETSVDQSIVTLLNGIAAQLEAAKGDEAALDNLTAQIRANSAAISAAVTANTPASLAVGPALPAEPAS